MYNKETRHGSYNYQDVCYFYQYKYDCAYSL
jgi:hypothetical protein